MSSHKWLTLGLLTPLVSTLWVIPSNGFRLWNGKNLEEIIQVFSEIRIQKNANIQQKYSVLAFMSSNNWHTLAIKFPLHAHCTVAIQAYGRLYKHDFTTPELYTYIGINLSCLTRWLLSHVKLRKFSLLYLAAKGSAYSYVSSSSADKRNAVKIIKWLERSIAIISAMTFTVINIFIRHAV
jgi:hypothetical protein